MSKLDKYFDSRAKDKRFKLLHEESSYLDILKGRAGFIDKGKSEEVTEESEVDGQTILPESEDPDNEIDVMESWLEDTFDEQPLDEISASILKKSVKVSDRVVKMGKGAKAKRIAALRTRRLSPGTARGAVRMGRI